MRFGLLFLLVFTLFVNSCTEHEPTQPDMGFDYFPLKVGIYSIYQVDETKISFSVESKASYEIKITIIDSIVSTSGETTYILRREKRSDESGSWKGLDTWSAKMINNRIVQNEENVLFVKLVFPPSVNLSWDGNEFNDLPFNNEIKDFYDGTDVPYVISSINEPLSLNTTFTTGDALVVIQNDLNDTFTGVDERKEIYARNVGLIYKEVRQLVYCTEDPSCYGQQNIDNGVILIQNLKEHGEM